VIARRALIAVLLAVATPTAVPAAEPAPLTQARAVKLVAREVDLAQRGRMAEAERAVTRRLAATRSGRERADLTEAFAIGLYAAAPAFDHPMTARAQAWFERAVDAYTEALQRDDPEIATALVRRAEVERAVHAEAPADWIDGAYRQAYRIRSARLGPESLVTLSTLIPMAELMVLPSRARGDGTAVEAAASMLRQAIEGAGQSDAPAAARLRIDAFDAMQRLQLLYGAASATPNPRISGATIQPCRDRIRADALVFTGNQDALEMLATRFLRAKLDLAPCGSALVFELAPGVDPAPVLGLLTDIASGKIRGLYMGLAESPTSAR